MKNPTREIRIGFYYSCAHLMSGDVLGPMTMDNFVHLVF